MLDANSVAEEDFMRSMSIKMKGKFDKYWGNCNLLISMACVLDPRYKKQMINFCFPLIYSEVECVEHIATVMENLRILYNEYVQTVSMVNAQSHDDSREETFGTSSSIVGKGKSRGKEEFREYIKKVEIVLEQEKSELDVYLEDKVHICEDDSTFDVLEWWKANNSKYRVLSKMACDIISIPVTTVASESAFSAGSRVIDQYRTSLGADTTQVLLCGED